MRPCVHVTAAVPDEIAAALAASFDLIPTPAGAYGLLTMVVDPVDDELLESAGAQLRVVANYGVGVNNVDLVAAARRGVIVTNTPDVLTRATAELAVTLMLSLLRRVTEGDRLVRRRTPWEFSLEFMLGKSLAGRRLLIIGPGRIGRETARLAEAFGAVVSFAGRSDDLAASLERTDIVSLHCPLTAATHHLIGRGELASMRPTAILVNTSRGPVVDESALVDALRDGLIAGAALDVYENEPQVSDQLLAFENVVLSPHLGSATRDTRIAMGMLCVEALRAVLIDGRVPANLVRAD
jgi:glyoxylate reductase